MGIPAGKTVINLNGYPAVYIDGQNRYVHRLVAQHYLGATLTRATFVHHVNEDREDFRPSNLHVCSHGEHNGLHRRSGKANHFFGKKHSDVAREKVSQAARRRTWERRSDGTFLRERP